MILRVLYEGDPVQGARFVPLVRQHASALVRSGRRRALLALPDGGRARLERVGAQVKCFIAAGEQPFYQFLCPTPLPRYDRTAQGATLLTGSAVAVDLTRLPLDAGQPIPDGTVFATGTAVEAPPDGVPLFAPGTPPNEFFLQRIPWQVDGLGTGIFAPSNRRPPPEETWNPRRALLTPWFNHATFVGNLSQLDWGAGPGLGDVGWDAPPIPAKGKRLNRIMNPDGDWPNASASVLADDGARYILMLASDLTLHAWRSDAPLGEHPSPYAAQNQRVTLDPANTRSVHLPLPAWASAATALFRDQYDPSAPGNLPYQPRPQGHFRHDGKRMAALLYRRQSSGARVKMREVDPALTDADHRLAFVDRGAAKVSPNPGVSEAPFPELATDALGWAEWDIAITVDAAGDFQVEATLARAISPDDARYAHAMPVGIGYAAPADWATSGTPQVATGDLLLATLRLYTDALWDQFNAWHTGAALGALLSPSVATVAVSKAESDSPLLTFALYDRRGMDGLEDSTQLLDAARAAGDEGLRGHGVTLYALDLTTLSALAVVNQYRYTAETTLLSHAPDPRPAGYPVTAHHAIHALGIVFGAVRTTDALAEFLPDAQDPAALLLTAPDVSGLSPLPTSALARVEVARFRVEDSGLAHWARNVLVTEETPTPSGLRPPRLLYRLYPGLYDTSAPPSSTPNRSFSAALSLCFDDYQAEIAADLGVDFAAFRAAIQAIVDGPMAPYLAARFPAAPPGNPFGSEEAAMAQVGAALDFFAGVNQTEAPVWFKSKDPLIDAGIADAEGRCRPFALAPYDYGRRTYNGEFNARLKYATYLTLGAGGWVAMSSALLVPTAPYRVQKAYWRGPDIIGGTPPDPAPDGQLRRTFGRFSDGWTDKAAFPANGWALRQIDHFFNLRGNARYSHRQFYNLAYGHAHDEAAFCDASLTVEESQTSDGLADGVWLRMTTPVDHPDASALTLLDRAEPFELVQPGAFPVDPKAVALGKHFFLGQRSWKPHAE